MQAVVAAIGQDGTRNGVQVEAELGSVRAGNDGEVIRRS